jgi:hypothetical protein
MTAQCVPPLHDFSSYSSIDSEHDDDESLAGRNEPVQPAEAQRRQFLGLAPPPGRLALIGGGIAAILVGGSIGFWLGRQTPSRPIARLRRTAATLESAIELAPVAMQLLANPIVRAMMIRLLIRQLSRRVPS